MGNTFQLAILMNLVFGVVNNEKILLINLGHLFQGAALLVSNCISCISRWRIKQRKSASTHYGIHYFHI